MSVIIKRYPNRKLYNTTTKRYITLDGIASLIRQGEVVEVVDHNSGENLTALTLSQIIFEQEKKQSGFLPTSILTGLIQSGGETLGTIRRTLGAPLRLFGPVEAEIDRRVQELVNRGELAFEEGAKLRNKLVGETWHTLRDRVPTADDVEQVLKSRNVPLSDDIVSLFTQLDSLTDRIEALIPNDDKAEGLDEEITITEISDSDGGDSAE